MKINRILAFVFVLVVALFASNVGANPDGSKVTCVSALDVEAPEYDSSRLAHGGGLNSCGCHFNRKTGECHCHKPRGCGCDCQPSSCDLDTDQTGQMGVRAVSLGVFEAR